MKLDIIISLLKYYSKFVSIDVRKKLFAKGNLPGYDEIKAEILAMPEDHAIKDIDAFIFSLNEEFLSDKIRNTKNTVLYVEYGAFSYDPTEMNGVREKLAVHVATPYNMKNSDNLSEVLLMNKTHNILCSILDQMEKDQKDLDFCGTRELIVFPAEIVPIDPRTFYDHTGWMGIFDNTDTNIL